MEQVSDLLDKITWSLEEFQKIASTLYFDPIIYFKENLKKVILYYKSYHVKRRFVVCLYIHNYIYVIYLKVHMQGKYVLKIKFDYVIYINRRTYVYNIKKVNALNVKEYIKYYYTFTCCFGR